MLCDCFGAWPNDNNHILESVSKPSMTALMFHNFHFFVCFLDNLIFKTIVDISEYTVIKVLSPCNQPLSSYTTHFLTAATPCMGSKPKRNHNKFSYSIHELLRNLRRWLTTQEEHLCQQVFMMWLQFLEGAQHDDIAKHD